MLRLTAIVGLLLTALGSLAQAQPLPREQRELVPPFERRDRGDQREFRDRREPRELRDRNRESSRGEVLLLLGEKRVDLNIDHDVLRVGQSEAWFQRRFFRALHFVVEDNDVYFDHVVIKYINGYVGPPRHIGRVVRRGSRAVLTLEDPVSYISQIEMVYKANNENSRGPALVKVYGEVVRVALPGRDEWVKFDCQDVSILDASYHIMEVGRRQGRFSTIRLHARDADIWVWELKVFYANGTSEDLDFRSYILAEQFSPDLDLRGNQRSIDRIEFSARSTVLPVDIILGEKVRRPKVCVEGLQFIPGDLLRNPSQQQQQQQSAPPPPKPPGS